MRVDVSNGKYTVVLPEPPETGGLHALRYGQPWRDLCGDKLVLSLASELEDARKKIEKLEQVLTNLGDL